MIKKISIAVVTLMVLASCVSPKIYKELEGKYTNLKKENRKLSEENEALLSAKTAAENELKQLQSAYDEACLLYTSDAADEYQRVLLSVGAG